MEYIYNVSNCFYYKDYYDVINNVNIKSIVSLNILFALYILRMITNSHEMINITYLKHLYSIKLIEIHLVLLLLLLRKIMKLI